MCASTLVETNTQLLDVCYSCLGDVQVNDLARLSLHNPQKIAVDAINSLADHLIQVIVSRQASIATL